MTRPFALTSTALLLVLAHAACTGEDPALDSSTPSENAADAGGGDSGQAPTCKGDTVEACGPSCAPCTAPTDGTSSCGDGTCKKTCAAGKTLCGDACVDVESSPDHCGKCGRSCEGGACFAKACQPVEVKGGLTDTHAIDVSGSDLVISAGRNVERCSAPRTCSPVATNYNDLKDVVATGTDLFWTSSDGDYMRVLRCPATGCPASIPAGSANEVENIVNATVSRVVAGPTHAVWTRSGYYGTSIMACKLPECSSIITVKAQPANTTDPGRETAIPITVMAASATKVFYATGIYNDGAPTVRSRDLATNGTVTNLANDGYAAVALTHAGSKLYGASGASNGTSNIIWSIDDGATTKSALSADAPGVSDIAVDDTGIYWTNATTGTVQRAPLTGAPGGETLATGQVGAKRVRVDGKFVYWTTPTSVMRVVK